MGAVPMSRTPQQAMRDAIVSGAVQAWIEGKDIQFSHIDSNDWVDSNGIEMPTFALKWVKWRIKPIPQKPTVADWRPISDFSPGRYLMKSKTGGHTIIINEIEFDYWKTIDVLVAPIPE
jgi:hypothetical protein